MKVQIVESMSGHKVVVLPDIIFKNRQNIDWEAVERYLQKYVGKMYLYDLVDIKREASTPLTIR